jgi:hypothetical protein
VTVGKLGELRRDRQADPARRAGDGDYLALGFLMDSAPAARLVEKCLITLVMYTSSVSISASRHSCAARRSLAGVGLAGIGGGG